MPVRDHLRDIARVDLSFKFGRQTIQVVRAFFFRAFLRGGRQHGKEVPDHAGDLRRCPAAVHDPALRRLEFSRSGVQLFSRVAGKGVRRVHEKFRVFRHVNEIGKRREDRESAAALSEDHRDLRDDAGASGLRPVKKAEAFQGVRDFL